MAVQVVGAPAKAIAAAGLGKTGASVLNALKGSKSSGGSTKQSTSSAKSISQSNTAGNLASARSLMYAQIANSAAKTNWDDAASYNAHEAAVNRAWQEYMANTQYQRAVEDMKAAGLNPILAAQNGIGGASIGSGAQASMTAPETFMGQSLAEQNSASSSESHSQSSGSSWSNSESGLATGLGLLADSLKNMQGAMNSSVTVENYISDLSKTGKEVGKTVKKVAKTAKEKVKDAAKAVKNSLNPKHESERDKALKASKNKPSYTKKK